MDITPEVPIPEIEKNKIYVLNEASVNEQYNKFEKEAEQSGDLFQQKPSVEFTHSYFQKVFGVNLDSLPTITEIPEDFDAQDFKYSEPVNPTGERTIPSYQFQTQVTDAENKYTVEKTVFFRPAGKYFTCDEFIKDGSGKWQRIGGNHDATYSDFMGFVTRVPKPTDIFTGRDGRVKPTYINQPETK